MPNQKYQVVVAGYDTLVKTASDGNMFIMTSDYLAAGRTADGTLVLAYLPTRRTISVDMTKLTGAATARSTDPGGYEDNIDWFGNPCRDCESIWYWTARYEKMVPLQPRMKLADRVRMPGGAFG